MYAGQALSPEPHPSLVGSSEGQYASPEDLMDSALSTFLEHSVCKHVEIWLPFPEVFGGFCQSDELSKHFPHGSVLLQPSSKCKCQ